MVEIYGKYGALVGRDELEDKFNDWRSAKLFVVGDEASSRAELVHNKNRLKALITSTTVQINPKNLPLARRAQPHQHRLSVQRAAAAGLDNLTAATGDLHARAREFEFPHKRQKDWKAAGGLAAFYDYLLTYPLGDFDPAHPRHSRRQAGSDRHEPQEPGAILAGNGPAASWICPTARAAWRRPTGLTSSTHSGWVTDFHAAQRFHPHGSAHQRGHGAPSGPTQTARRSGWPTSPRT